MRESLRRTGQRFLVGFDGFEASPDIKRLIRDYRVGHVILFSRNVSEPEQVAELIKELQSCARDAGHDLPLLVSIDQEGGRVARLQRPWTLWPPLRALGRIGDDDLSRRMGAALATELSACGIRWDYAPVMDVDTNPANPVIGDRSFGDDPALVTRLGMAMIRGLQDGGVAACAKHFPGHGDTATDSHLELPVVHHPRSRLEEVELPPFEAALQAGVATIMTAHILVPELDETLPATLSPRVILELLRHQINYEVAVISDDLEMNAVAKHWPPAEASVLAAKAGCDILSICQNHDAQVEGIEAVVRAFEAEELPWSWMEFSEARIRRLKERFLLPYRDPNPREARAAAGTGDALAQEISERGGLPILTREEYALRQGEGMGLRK
jgi:beta-N-acetylhexosaminidase